MTAILPAFRRLPLALALLLAAAAGPLRVAAQYLPWENQEEEDSPFGIRLEFLKLDVEAQSSSYKITGAATRDWNQVTLLPALGIKWNHYVYSPYLLNYALVFEPGYFWQRGTSAGRPMLTKEAMLNGRATATLLTVKPFATTFSLGRSHQQMHSDFFTSQTVDLQSWSVHSGYSAGRLPFTVNVERTKEDRNSGSQEFVSDQLRFGLHAINDRKNQDTTILDYQFNRFENRSITSNGLYLTRSSSHHALVTDREIFKNGSLYSSLNFNTLATGGSSATSTNGTLNYNRDLTTQLRGFSTYTLTASNGSGYEVIQHNLVAGLNHQLFESLGSHVDVHGLRSDSHAGGADLAASTYGISGSISYAKRLGHWGNLALNQSLSFDLSDEQSTGSELIIPSESYTIPATGPMLVRLKSPRVAAITSITKNNAPLDPTEWKALTGSNPWQVQFFGGGAHALVGGDTIQITYIVQPNPTGRYSTTSYYGSINLRLWQDLLGLRVGYQTTTNHTNATGFELQSIRQYQLGCDVTWRGLRGDASYTHENSTLYAFQSRALNESYTRPVGYQASVGLTFNQQWVNYPAGSGGTGQHAQDLSYFNYLLHGEWRPGGGLSLNVECGLQHQRGTLQNQDLFAGRVHLSWVHTKLEVHCGFEHENLDYVKDVYARNFFFLRMRRTF